MKRADYRRYVLYFKEEAGTSRGVLREKETFFVRVWEEDTPAIVGIGECALFRGLSAEDKEGYEEKLSEVCKGIEKVNMDELEEWSSIRFGLEMALRNLAEGGGQLYFPSAFTEGKRSIEINGLIWMGDKSAMLKRIEQKLEAGFHCIKLKIGAIDFEEELSLLYYIRKYFGKEDVELRVDANGAFSSEEVMYKLKKLSAFDLHSIEQPIRQGQWEDMARVCKMSPVPVALDEELIGVYGTEGKKALLDAIMPQYIILKPALCGGFSGAEEWIKLAEERNVGWWVTSALESNVGLNALAQWVATLKNPMPQGLGTGQLYTNNIPSPLRQEGKYLIYKK